MKKRSFIALFLLLALLVPSAAFAEGFGIYEWSASGSGMGEAYMFGEEDPAVLAYNPAAITRLNGRYLSLGASFFDPFYRTEFHNFGPLNAMHAGNNLWENEYSPEVAPYLYYVDKAGKNSWWGVALFSRYGNNLDYDNLWPGRYDTVYSGIKGFTVQPTYAWRFGKDNKWSAAVGLDINYVNLRMKSDKPSGTMYGSIGSNLDGTSYAVGGVVAINYDFNPNTSAALVYRSRIKHDMDADVDISTLIPLVGNFTTQAHGSVTLPDSLTFGVSHKFNEGRTRVEADIVWTNWATYDSLNLNFDKNPLGANLEKVSSVKNWEAAWRFNLGIEHKLSDKWSILLGYVWDQSPVPDEYMDFTVPTGDRHRGSIGFKYRPAENHELSFAYTAIVPAERTVHSNLPYPATGADFGSATTKDGLTQVVALGYTIKLK